MVYQFTVILPALDVLEKAPKMAPTVKRTIIRSKNRFSPLIDWNLGIEENQNSNSIGTVTYIDY